MTSPANDLLDRALDRQREAWLSGARPTVELIARSASIPSEPDFLLDLIYNEIVLREEIGESPQLDEYLEKFPQLGEDLQLHFEVHRAIQENLLLETRRPLDSESGNEIGRFSNSTQPSFTDYEIVSELGSGGMGVVFKARHRGLKRFVALKMLHPDRLASSRDMGRFRVEAETIARLQHPNIVQIFEVGQNRGTPFLALELAEQGTLQKKLQLQPYAAKPAAELIETLGRAVEHAHRQQVIHRDLKPANVLFTADGVPKIADFGLAKLLETDSVNSQDTTRTGEPMGTPRYMAPEQASGKRDEIGPATDIYALGTILYECLTGKAPFVSASVVETVDRIRHDDPVPPRRLNPAIPRDLETICLHCLQKQPRHRYSTAQELVDDVRRFLNREPIRAKRTPLWLKTWMWCCRNPALATWAAVAYALVLSAIAWVVVHRYQEQARIASLRSDVLSLVREGQIASARGEAREAKECFQAALAKVLSEPALHDHELGVRGWLDHSHRENQHQRWSQRLRPPLFEERRDDAFVRAFFVDIRKPESVRTAREAIAGALEFVLANDPAWRLERELLLVLDASLVFNQGDARQALAILETTQGFTTRSGFYLRSECLKALGRAEEAEKDRVQVANLVPKVGVEALFQGIAHWQGRKPEESIRRFDEALMLDPDFFLARFLQAVSFLQAKRAGEAEVGLTACLAERPRFAWCLVLRGQAHTELGEFAQAAQDFQQAKETKPNEAVLERLAQAIHEWDDAIGALPFERQEKIWDTEIRTEGGRVPLRRVQAFRVAKKENMPSPSK